MPTASQVDYAALAKKHGATVDYAALAKKHGATASPAVQPPQKPQEGFFRSALDQTPLSLLPLLLMNPVQVAQAVKAGVKDTVHNAETEGKAAYDTAKQGSYGASAAHAIQALPWIGQAMKKAGEQMPAATGGYTDLLKALVTSPGAMGTLVGTSAMLAEPGARGIAKIGGGELLRDAADAARAPGHAIRSVAIGDKDAAAMRGLKMPPKSPKMQRMTKNVQLTRPYLKGVRSLESLQDRLKQAKDEVWSPYEDTIKAVGHRPVKGPDGMTTIGELEAERKQLSAENQALKQRDPQAVQTAMQKGLSQADLIKREKLVKSYLDDELKKYGIKPKLIRKYYSALLQMEKQVAGKSNLLEPKQLYGVGRIGNVGFNPLKDVKELGSAIRDTAALRIKPRGSPSDIGIREGFRTGGPKPDLGAYKPSPFVPIAERLPPLPRLPARAGGFFLLPYYPEMTPGERVAALVREFQRSQPLALPAKTQPIRLPPPSQ